MYFYVTSLTTLSNKHTVQYRFCSCSFKCKPWIYFSWSILFFIGYSHSESDQINIMCLQHSFYLCSFVSIAIYIIVADCVYMWLVKYTFTLCWLQIIICIEIQCINNVAIKVLRYSYIVSVLACYPWWVLLIIIIIIIVMYKCSHFILKICLACIVTTL